MNNRFWNKINKNSSCWLWIGVKDRFGYGRFSLDGRMVYAHRIIWEYVNGSIPNGLFVLHKCDVPACVNPEHLFLGTQSDNLKDAYQKGHLRHLSGFRGEKQGQSKLTDEIVKSIREEYQNPKTSQYQLAKRYGVCQTTIWRVVKRKSWAHIL